MQILIAGCLPIVVQIPIFFSLYKVLFVTIEMYHAPFYGWIHDLSAPDPLGILTVFGLNYLGMFLIVLYQLSILEFYQFLWVLLCGFNKN